MLGSQGARNPGDANVVRTSMELEQFYPKKSEFPKFAVAHHRARPIRWPVVQGASTLGGRRRGKSINRLRQRGAVGAIPRPGGPALRQGAMPAGRGICDQAHVRSECPREAKGLTPSAGTTGGVMRLGAERAVLGRGRGQASLRPSIHRWRRPAPGRCDARWPPAASRSCRTRSGTMRCGRSAHMRELVGPPALGVSAVADTLGYVHRRFLPFARVRFVRITSKMYKSGSRPSTIHARLATMFMTCANQSFCRPGRFPMARMVAGLVFTFGNFWMPAPGHGGEPHANLGQEVEIPGDTGKIKGFLVKPEGDGPFPAIVVVPDWWGLTDWVKDNGARPGQTRIRGSRGGPVRRQRHRRPSGRLQACACELNHDQAVAKLKAGVSYLSGLESVVKSKPVGAIGWSLGGQLACKLAENSDRVGPLVVCYGGVPASRHAWPSSRASRSC